MYQCGTGSLIPMNKFHNTKISEYTCTVFLIHNVLVTKQELAQMDRTLSVCVCVRERGRLHSIHVLTKGNDDG